MQEITDLNNAIPKEGERYAVVAGNNEQFKYLLDMYYDQTGLNMRDRLKCINKIHDMYGRQFEKCLFYGTWYKRDSEEKYRIMEYLQHRGTPYFQVLD
jgi:aromatic ring hydroxylase